MGNLKLKGFVFAQVPIWLLACSDVDPQAKVIYAYLVWRQGQNEGCWPSVDRIAQDLQVERKTVMRHLQRLEEMGYIQVHRQTGCSNFYVINGEVPEQVTLSEQLMAELKINRLAASVEASDPEREPDPEVEDSGAKAWNAILDNLSLTMGRGVVATLRRVSKAQRVDSRVVVKVSNDYWRDWLEGRAKGAIQKMLTQELREEVTVEFRRGRV